MRAKRVLLVVLLVLLAIVSGIGIAAYRIMSVKNSPVFAQYGSWRGTKDLPLNRNNLITTQVTLFALFALPSNEAIYLFAPDDRDNKRLDGSADYILTGNIHDVKANYWSITAYGNDLYLIPNEADRFSFNANNLVIDSAGNYTITISATHKPGNWLPVKTGKEFQLVLRIYKGEHEFVNHLDKARLPIIKKI